MVVGRCLLALLGIGVGFAVYIVCKCRRLLAIGRVANSSGAERRDPYTARPDRRGMGSQDHFDSETFVPSAAHRARQVSMAQSLIAAGADPVQVAALLTIPADLVTPKKEDPHDTVGGSKWKP